MKKILISISVIAAVAAVVFGVTTAFFSDTETSTGNTFTAGSIDLKVDNTCHYDGMVCEDRDNGYRWYEEEANSSTYPELIEQLCECTWLSKDLNGEVFFNFTDIKPGDKGEDTLSFHLESNDAWACVVVSEIIDSDNTCTEPELEIEDTDCTGLESDGELDNHLYVIAWIDDGAGSNGIKCDNIRNGDEQLLTEGYVGSYLSNATGDKYVIPVADSSSGSLMGQNVALAAGDYCIGIAWSVDTDAGNDVQTDQLGADLKFYVEQWRNNPDFTCSGAF